MNAPVSGPTLPVWARGLRILITLPALSPAHVDDIQSLARVGAALGLDPSIYLFQTGPSWPTFPVLHELWRNRDARLLQAYEQVRRLALDCHVLMCWGGSCLHPDFVRQLPVYTIYTCSDDPESSDLLSKPVAPAFDFVFAHNLACLDLYRSWGCAQVAWLFHPARKPFLLPAVSAESLAPARRTVPAVLACGLVASPLHDARNRRAERLAREFPDASFHGEGWPQGPIGRAELAALYHRTRIGWNLNL